MGMLRFVLLYFVFDILYHIYDTREIKGYHEKQLFLDVIACFPVKSSNIEKFIRMYNHR